MSHNAVRFLAQFLGAAGREAAANVARRTSDAVAARGRVADDRRRAPGRASGRGVARPTANERAAHAAVSRRRAAFGADAAVGGRAAELPDFGWPLSGVTPATVVDRGRVLDFSAGPIETGGEHY